ncbi:hypothetical protein OHA25_03290 [Nonomuraea sp. NBC_00507]
MHRNFGHPCADGALVAGAAEEGVDLGFDGGLDDQAGAEPGDVLDDLDQVTIGGEQGIDLGTDGLDRRYSTGHERGAFLRANLAVQHGTTLVILDRAQSERPVTAFPLVTGLFPLVWQVQGSNLRRLSRRFYGPVAIML